MSFTRGKRGPRVSAAADAAMTRTADFSPNGLYRYKLSRIWDASRMPLGVVMFNPSTADALYDDATVRRCIALARGWGYGGLRVYNLFALVSTDPKAVGQAGRQAVGSENDAFLRNAFRISALVCAWGALPTAQRVGWRLREFAALVGDRPVHAIALTASGAPQHPLYVKAGPAPVPFSLESYR